MSDLEDRLSRLDGLRFTDRWDEIKKGSPRTSPRGPRRGQRVIALVAGIAIGVAGSLVAFRTLRPSSESQTAGETSGWRAGSVSNLGVSFRYPPAWHVQPLDVSFEGIGGPSGVLITNTPDISYQHPRLKNGVSTNWDMRSLPPDGVALSITAWTAGPDPIAVPPDFAQLLSHPSAIKYPGTAQAFRMQFHEGWIPTQPILVAEAWIGPQASGESRTELQKVIASVNGAGTPAPSPSGNPDQVVSESQMLTRFPGVVCTAMMPSIVEPGAPLGLVFTLENGSSSPVDVSTSPPSYPFTITDGNGTVWNAATLMNHSWPAYISVPLKPRATERVDPQPVRVQFPGPLTVRPTCAGEHMPPLMVAVDGRGSSVPDALAVSRAAASTSGLLDHCPPQPNSSVVGSITPPNAVGGSPSMAARCSATVGSYPGFSVVTFVISIPAGAPTPSIRAGFLSAVDLPTTRGNAETIVWRFVIKDSAVIPVASATHTRTVAGKGATEYGFNVSPSGWSKGDQPVCGGDGYGFGGDGRSIYIVFPDSCVRP